MPANVAQIFDWLVHGVLLLAAFGMLLLILNVIDGRLADNFDSRQERFMRGLAASGGLLIWVASKAGGVSITGLLLEVFSISSPWFVGVARIVYPAVAGFIIAWYVILHINRRGNEIAIRIMTLIATLVFFLYCDSYASKFGEGARPNFADLLPDIIFVLSILLYAIFNVRPVQAAPRK